MEPSVISPYPSLEALGSSSSSDSGDAARRSAVDPPRSGFCGVGGDNVHVVAATPDARRLRGPSTSQSEVRPQFRNVFLSTYRYTLWRCDVEGAGSGFWVSAETGGKNAFFVSNRYPW